MRMMECEDANVMETINFWEVVVPLPPSSSIKEELRTVEQIARFEAQITSFNLERKRVRLHVALLEFRDVDVPIWECCVEDISREVNLQEDYSRLRDLVQEKRKQFDALGRMILSTSFLEDLPSLLKLICSEAVISLGMRAAQIWLLQKNALRGFVGHGVGEDLISGLEIPLADSNHICVQVLEKKSPLQMSGSMKDGKFIHEALVGYFSVNTLLVAPLLVSGRAVGVLVLFDDRDGHLFEGDDLELTLQMGNQAAIAIENVRMLDDLKAASKNIEDAYDATLAGWARALELRDMDTEGHTQRVTRITLELAKKFGIDQDNLTHIYRGSLLHDIGKMGIPDGILLKPGPLNEFEQEVMRRHPVYAYEMLKPIEYLHPALEIPYCHHEKWDGTGYPRGLKGEDIPLSARIFAVVDVWDALSHDRPYRKAWESEDVLMMIKRGASSHFDPQVVEKFLEILPSLEEIIP